MSFSIFMVYEDGTEHLWGASNKTLKQALFSRLLSSAWTKRWKITDNLNRESLKLNEEQCRFLDNINMENQKVETLDELARFLKLQAFI